LGEGGKARGGSQLEWSIPGGSTLVGFRLACKYWTWAEVIVSGKRSILLKNSNNYGCKKFYNTSPMGRHIS